MQSARSTILVAAYSLKLEKEVGNIVPGKLANFAFLVISRQLVTLQQSNEAHL